MSSATSISAVNQLNKEIASLEKNLSDEMKKEADLVKKINDIKRSITKSTSTTTLQSKSRQVDTHNANLAKVVAKKADINKCLADKRGKLNTASIKLQKEQQTEQQKQIEEQQKVQKNYESKINELTSQILSASAPAAKKSLEIVPEIKEEYDVFISHASEDKDAFVRELATVLRDEYGVKVWYDEFSIKWRDSLRSSIDKGLVNSKYGIVVISRSFIKKGWTYPELDGLFQIEMTNVRKAFFIIWEASRRLANTVVENKDFEALIRQYDRDNAFFYCDPPYYETEGHYAVVFRKEDHTRLRDTLACRL